MNYTKDEVWDYLVAHGIATDKEISLVTEINGYSMESLLDIIYARTGYKYMEQLMEEFGDE